MKLNVTKNKRGVRGGADILRSILPHPKSILALLLLFTVLSRSTIPDKSCTTNVDCETIAPFAYCDQTGYLTEGKCACIGGRTYNPNQRKCQCNQETNKAAASNDLLIGSHGGCISVNKKWQSVTCVSGNITKFKVPGTDSTGAYCKCNKDFYGESCEFDRRKDDIVKKWREKEEQQNRNLGTIRNDEQQNENSSSLLLVLSFVAAIVILVFVSGYSYRLKRVIKQKEIVCENQLNELEPLRENAKTEKSEQIKTESLEQEIKDLKESVKDITLIKLTLEKDVKERDIKIECHEQEIKDLKEKLKDITLVKLTLEKDVKERLAKDEEERKQRRRDLI